MTTASHKIKVIYYIGKGEGLGTKASQALMRVGDWGEGGGEFAKVKVSEFTTKTL